MLKPSVLVAEDESALATLLRFNLEREGYRVLHASDGEEALLIAAEETPDMVLLDWMLPELSGIEVCRACAGVRKPAMHDHHADGARRRNRSYSRAGYRC